MRTLILGLLALATTLMAPAAHAIEEPAYVVERTLGESVEIRRYAPYVVAEVVIDAPAEEAGNLTFPILANRDHAQKLAALIRHHVHEVAVRS